MLEMMQQWGNVLKRNKESLVPELLAESLDTAGTGESHLSRNVSDEVSM